MIQVFSRMPLQGKFRVEHLDKNGLLKGIYDIPNGITTPGKNSLLDIMFRAQTQITTWAIGLVNNVGWTAFADADTIASHAGWTEFVDYNESNRVTWTPAAAASAAISNTSTSNFTINANGNLKGLFLCSNNTKSGTTGVLWATAPYASVIAVSVADILKVTYGVTS